MGSYANRNSQTFDKMIRKVFVYSNGKKIIGIEFFTDNDKYIVTCGTPMGSTMKYEVVLDSDETIVGILAQSDEYNVFAIGFIIAQ